MDDARLRASKLQSAECHHKANAKHGTEHYTRKVNISTYISINIDIYLYLYFMNATTRQTWQTGHRALYPQVRY